jgi:NAD-dependent deacetylase
MLDLVAGWMRDAERLVVLTGAGMSAESGVPVFRGPGGLWRQFRPEDLATPDAFRRQPELVWEWYLWRRAKIAEATPHEGHAMLARLDSSVEAWNAEAERSRPRVRLLTQNVDRLHQRAGSRDPVELHGNLWHVRCSAGCGFSALDEPEAPPRTVLHCECGAWLRPSVVWFGEALCVEELAQAEEAIERADLVLVVGTSAVVYPVAALPHLAAQRGVRLVEINVEETALSSCAHATLRGRAGDVLPALERLLPPSHSVLRRTGSPSPDARTR